MVKRSGEMLVYTGNGRMSVHVLKMNRPALASGDQMNGTAPEIKAAFEGMVSYYGTYETDLENGFVVHQVIGSVFPNWEGQSNKRFFKIEGDRLELTTQPMPWGDKGEVVGALIWERIRNQEEK